MGVETSYQAIPEGTALLERAIQDPDLGELLGLLNSSLHGSWYESARRGGPPLNETEETLQHMALSLEHAHPGLKQRFYTLDRRWDMLHFLLSAERRGEPSLPLDDLFTVAVRGGALLAPHIRGGQGHPIRIVSAAQTQALAARLAEVSQNDLRRHYVPERMEEAAVYKWFAAHVSDSTWPVLWDAFEGLRDFYREVAAHGEAVLVIQS
ncbi:hypothetical protein A176_005295 [Myxococcus hansupus]|uniref:DUF1877 family protein n=1 Tax=Pseudomyxococcus hansupus TaxID=1297742 RepID=A0A0H4X3B4_9BACT|nr:DUF1877 family protein [Myxococcus hansupus]AKQ68383.1 hypothetical protein A176_005295 [Myxococcus hansupus]